jgi:hypothetical protein
MTRAEFLATCPSAKHLLAPDHVLERRIVQLRRQIKALRYLQVPSHFEFWFIERIIARREDEIERLQS